MKIIKQVVKFYILGVLFTASLILIIYLFDSLSNDHIYYAEAKNYIATCLICGIPFGLTIFSIFKQD